MTAAVLVSHSCIPENRASLATLDQVREVPTPAATPSFRPVPHAEIVAEVVGAVAALGMTVRRSEFSLTARGNRFFGVFDLVDEQTSLATGNEVGLAVGARNSHDKSMSMGIAAGTRVFVCDNLAFSGDVVQYRKHTSGLVAAEVVKSAMERTVDAARVEAAWLNRLREAPLSDAEAKALLIDALRAGACTSRQLPGVTEAYFRNAWAGYRADLAWTAWALHQCFTAAFRAQRLDNTLRRCKPLNRILGQVVTRN